MSRPAARTARFLMPLLGAMFAVGCNTTPSKPSLMANMARDDLTVYQLRAMDYEYAARFAQLVSAAASDIIAAFPGAAGTHSEIRLAAAHHRPVVLVGWGTADLETETRDALAAHEVMPAEAATPEAAVQAIAAVIGS